MDSIGSAGDIATRLIGVQQDAMENRIGVAMIRQAKQADDELIAMLDRSLQGGPPAAPGTGTLVDKRA